MQIIPLKAVPSQSFSTVLGNQLVDISVYQVRYGLFVNLYLNGALVIGGVIAENLNRIVRSTYLGFDGDLFFQDTRGNEDPNFAGLGDRFLFYYGTAADIAALEWKAVA